MLQDREIRDEPADNRTKMTDPETAPTVRENGAAEWTRTTDLLITNQLLYQLSYSGAGRCGASPSGGRVYSPIRLPRQGPD